ncbi:MAG: 3-deoxy-D-manno-octulosonic acid transferase [Bacteroidales bacterium]|nr:3-deoxy-D-manno-octulosonic acid transferase [Bacteroidales bacterium]
MKTLYSLGIRLYSLAIRIAKVFGHNKARKMVDGWRDINRALQTLKPNVPTVWFHVSSLGEYEQALPVMQQYRTLHPNVQQLLTFFSPSGYEVRHNNSTADVVCYFPMDTPGNARRFIERINPLAVFFVKYDFWFNTLHELNQRAIPTYIFSAIFRPGQYFFKWYGGWYLRGLKTYTHIFVQNEQSASLLRAHGINCVTQAGDTRFDRVWQIAQSHSGNTPIETFLDNSSRVIVAGSTWEPDEILLARYLKETDVPVQIILAPHIISDDHLSNIEKLFPQSICYSILCKQGGTAKVVIIDNIGMLSMLYRYADVAYIGGGFGHGIHNTLEAMTYGKPVIFGTNYHKFKEACDIIERQGGWSIASYDELRHRLDSLFTQPTLLSSASTNCLNYVKSNLGSTETILNTIEQ